MEEKQLEKLIRRLEAATARLIEADKELASLKDDQYVTWEWVCWYLNVDQPKAIRMLAEEAMYVFDGTLMRFMKADIIRFAKRHKTQVKELSCDFILRKPPKVKEGVQDEVSVPTGFAKFDDKRAEMDRMMARIMATRDKAIDRERAKQSNLLPPQSRLKSKRKGKSGFS